LARSIEIICLISGLLIFGCTRSKPNFVVGNEASNYEKEMLTALFRASEWKINVDSCEIYTFATAGEFPAWIFSSYGRLQDISLQCPKEENGNLFREFNISHNRSNTPVRFAYDPRRNQLLKSFEPQCISVP
jgi:hypothetical protein